MALLTFCESVTMFAIGALLLGLGIYFLADKAPIVDENEELK